MLFCHIILYPECDFYSSIQRKRLKSMKLFKSLVLKSIAVYFDFLSTAAAYSGWRRINESGVVWPAQGQVLSTGTCFETGNRYPRCRHQQEAQGGVATLSHPPRTSSSVIFLLYHVGRVITAVVCSIVSQAM